MMAAPSGQAGAWRDGSFLVLRRDTPVGPDRCIVTNEPVFGIKKFSRRLSWGKNGPSGHWLPTKFQILWALADMKYVTVQVGLSERVKAKRCGFMILYLVSMLGGLALIVYGLRQGVPPPMTYLGAGVVLVVIPLNQWANTYMIVDIVAMDEDYVWLRGAKKPFLDSLPLFQSK